MKRWIRVEYAGVIFASLLFVLLIGLIEIRGLEQGGWIDAPERNTAQPGTIEPPADVSEELDCAQIESEFAAKLEQSRSCLVDADCSLARLECPFECVTSVSTSVLDDLKRDEMTLQRSCRRCVSSCPETLAKWRAACVRQRCIVLDRSIEELQEETLQLMDESG